MQLGDKMPKELVQKVVSSSLEKFPLLSDIMKKLNENVEVVAKISSKRLQETKDQKKLLLLTLVDRSGSLRAVDWHNAEENFEKLSEGDVILAKGRIVYFEDHLQLNLDKSKDSVRVMQEEEYDIERFVETTPEDIEKLQRKLKELIDDIQDKEIRNLLKELFEKDEQFFSKFIKVPAGVSVHHTYIGGLLEHTVAVASICKKIWSVYENALNKDLLIAGAILHDIGKVQEYTITKKGFEVTTEGELKSHIALGVEILQSKAKNVQISKGKLMQLEHIILSHHGELEWGSPVVPKTAEAFVIHMVENMDAKLARFRSICQKEKKNGNTKLWSEFDKHLQRRIWLGGFDEED
ncbi:3'-5' exoribonuclease YhaM family protein [Pseudothermotoga thermarum]|uniref:Metal dependent phosphohydrolase n=1 Tax=Pseudothermotoga thermarum DSM 5069 TaxID=688269 RepID=F7YV44_9THEM|nr:HD domain-containing protein [Pseudothermotoga thermarum]AEH50343.1 metal dependent phosphohydrolase [Pseudothermotoga thermarum DSM 5069]